MVAAFIALRLRSVLGRRTGHERRRSGGFGPARANGAADNVVALPERSSAQAEVEATIAAPADKGVKAGLAQIRLADQRFDLQRFLRAARAAFEMIVEAYAARATRWPPAASGRRRLQRLRAGDRRAPDGRSQPRDPIDRCARRPRWSAPRCAAGTRASPCGSRASRSTSCAMPKARCSMAIRRPPRVVDLWTFERDTASQDPNWTLVETRTPT